MSGKFDDFVDGLDPNAPLGDATIGSTTSMQAPAAGKFDAFVDDLAAQRDGAISAQALGAAKVNPDTHAEAAKLGDKYGLPADMAERNMPWLKERSMVEGVTDAFKSIDLGRLEDWYLADPTHANVTTPEDIRQLGKLRWVLNAVGPAFTEGMGTLELGKLRFHEMLGSATVRDVERADELSSRKAADYGADGWFSKGAVEAAKMLPMMLDSIGTGMDRGVKTGAVYGGIAALATAPIPGVDAATPVTAGAGFVAGYGVGQISGSFESSFMTEAGLAYDEFKQIKDANGRTMDPDVARAAALIAGAANGMLEVYGINKVGKNIPGVREALGYIGRDTIAEALKSRTVTESLKAFGRRYAEGMTVETLTEVAQEAVTMFSGEIAKSAADGQFQHITASEAIGRLTDTLIATAQAMTIMAVPGPGASLASDVSAARKAERNARVMEALGETAKDTKLIDRLPSKAQDAIKAVLDGGDVENVYVPADKLVELFQSVAVDPRTLDKAIPGFSAMVAEAQTEGRDVAIPLDAYVTHLARTDLHSGLIDNARFHPGDMTPSEARTFNEQWADIREQLFAEAEAQQPQRDASGKTSADAVFDDIKAKAMEAGIAPAKAEEYATLYKSFFNAMGERSGNDAWALYSKYGLDIQRELPASVTARHPAGGMADAVKTIRNRKKVSASKLFGPSLLEFISKRGGLQDDGGELAAMDAGLWHKGRPGRARLLREAGKDGATDLLAGTPGAGGLDYSLDGTALAAQEAGFFPAAEDRPTPDQLLEAIRGELSGSPVYAEVNRNAELADKEAFLDQLDAAIGQLGIDIAGMTDEQVVEALRGAAKGEAPVQAGGAERTINQDKRGSLRFDPTKRDRFILTMFQKADLSTFLHESGHFFLEVMADVAQTADAPDQVNTDWQTVKTALGIPDDGPIPTEAHEAWAKGFERYLFEGKAPSEELRSAFGKFAAWLKMVYRWVDKQLGGKVSPDVTAVMDRMLATDEEIDAAEALYRSRLQLPSAEVAGVSEAEWADLNRIATDADKAAREQLTARLLADVKREQTAEWRAEQAKVREDVTQELHAMPVYQVIKYLRTGGHFPGFEPVTTLGRMRLDRDQLTRMFGADVLKDLPKGVPPLYADKGWHPSDLAQVFGFNSAAEMVEALKAAPSLAEAIKAETASRMLARHGDLNTDLARRAEEAVAALHTDQRGKVLAAELRALSRKAATVEHQGKRWNVGPVLPLEKAQEIARDVIARKSVKDAGRVSVYAAAERRAAKAAEEAILAERWDDARDWKRKQLVNHAIVQEAIKASRDIDAAMSYLRRFTKKKAGPGALDVQYVLQIRKLLARHGLAALKPDEVQSVEDTAAWAAQQEAEGFLFNAPATLTNDADTREYKELTVEEFRGLRDAVKNIATIGKLAKKLETAEGMIAFEEAVDDLTGSIDGKFPATGGAGNPPRMTPSKLERWGERLQGMDAGLLKIEQIVMWLDGDDVNGPAHRYLWRPFVDAQNRQMDMEKETTARIMQAFDSLPKAIRERLREELPTTTVPATGYRMTRENMIAAALNVGNESNLDKIMRGEGWSQGTLDHVLSHMTAEEWRFVQEVWGIVNSFWPEIAALQKKLTGLEPPKVEGRDFTVTVNGQDLVMRGGYYPIMYDARRDTSGRIGKLDEKKADALYENLYLKPETAHGHTIGRTNAAYPLRLDLGVLPIHISQVIHDLTHREAVRQTDKLLANGRVREAITGALGRKVYEQFRPWVQSIAQDRVDNRGMRDWEALLRGVRLNAGIMALGYRVTTMLAQFTQPIQAAEMIGPVWMAKGIRMCFGEHGGSNAMEKMAAAGAFVRERSGEMRHRHDTIERDIRDTIRRQVESGAGFKGMGLLDKFKAHAYDGIGFVDKITTIPIWLGAYHKHLSLNPGDETGAVAYGDQAVRMTQSAGAAKDLAAVQRGGEMWKLLSMFYSYFSVLYARQRDIVREATKARSFPEAMHVAQRVLFLVVMPSILGDLLTGKGPDDEEGEGWWEWMLARIILYPVQAVPVVRDIINSIEKGRGYSMSPAGRLGDTLNSLAKDAIKLVSGELDTEEEAVKATKHVVDTAGLLTGVPVGQFTSTGMNVWKGLDKGDLGPADLIFTRKN